jgi:chromosome segregation ATPase
MAAHPVIDPWSDSSSYTDGPREDVTLARIVAGLVQEIEDLREDNRTLRWRLDALTNRLAEIIGQLERLEERTQTTRSEVATIAARPEAPVEPAAAERELLGTWSESLRMEVSALMNDREDLPAATSELVRALERIMAPWDESEDEGATSTDGQRPDPDSATPH